MNRSGHWKTAIFRHGRTVLVAALPAAILLGFIAALDIGITQLDNYSRTQLGPLYSEMLDEDFAEDPEYHYYAMQEDPESLSEEQSSFVASEFNPNGNGSISPRSFRVFASATVQSAWPHIDAPIKNRILLVSLYPYDRLEEGSEEIGRVLAAAKLSNRYRNVGHTFEFVSRAAVAGRHDDVAAFLEAYKSCIASGKCVGSNFYEKAAGAIFEVYSVPASELLAKGQCVRARYVNALALRMLGAIDTPRFVANSAANEIYMLSAITEQPECQRNAGVFREAFGNSMSIQSLSYSTDSSTLLDLFEDNAWSHRFPALGAYAAAVGQFRDGRHLQAFVQLNQMRTTDSGVLQDMRRLMQIRALFELAKSTASSATVALDEQAAMSRLAAAVRTPSLRSDAVEYSEEVASWRLDDGTGQPTLSAVDVELALSE